MRSLATHLDAAADGEEDGQPLSSEEIAELERLEKWKAEQAREQRRRLRLLRGEHQESLSRSSGSAGHAARVPDHGGLMSPAGTVLGDARSMTEFAEGRLLGTPGLETLEARLAARLRGTATGDAGDARSRSPPDHRVERPRLPTTPTGHTGQVTPVRGPTGLAAGPSVPAGAAVGGAAVGAPLLAAGTGAAGLPPMAGNTPAGWEEAVRFMASAVQTMASSLSENKDASVLKLERKRPTVRMETAEGFMNEVVALENTYAETNARTFRRRWGIFRPSLESRAKETVEVELERRGLSAERIANFVEDDFKALYEYLMGYMERSCGLTVDRKAEIALATMAKVGMQEGSGP